MAKESSALRNRLSTLDTLVRNKIETVPRDTPFIGPLLHGEPGRGASLASSLAVPVAIGIVEYSLATALHENVKDLTPLFIATLAIGGIARVIEAETLRQRGWNSNGMVLGVKDILDKLEKSEKHKKIAKVAKTMNKSTLAISTAAKGLALGTYPPNWPIFAVSLIEHDPSKMVSLLITQGLGDLALAVINSIELLFPRTFMKD